MDEKNVPRRMRRFYREGKELPAQEANYAYDSFDSKNSYDGSIPSMGYEDLEKHLSDENKKEIQRLEQGDLEQKLALFEVEKFKKKNNRLPNKKESQQIADSLYTQLKDEPPSMDGLAQGEEKSSRRGRRKGRDKMPPSKRKRMQKDRMMQEEANADAAIMPKGDIKDLFGSAGGAAAGGIEDEFKLDLGGGDATPSDDLGELGELSDTDDFSLGSMDEQSTCPSCKQKTDKIIYCAKCGAAFCKNCGTANGELVCPKCKTRVKK